MVIENNKQGLVIGVGQFSVSRLYHFVRGQCHGRSAIQNLTIWLYHFVLGQCHGRSVVQNLTIWAFWFY